MVRRSLWFLLVLGVSLPVAVSGAAAQPIDGLFERYEVGTGPAEHRQTVLTGFFRGGPTAELVVVRVEENGDRRLQMYGFDGGAWVPVLEATLRPEVLFVDVAGDGVRDRLITYQHGRVSWFDPESATERVLLEIPASYKPGEGGEIPRVDITRDLNHDGRDDLVVPAVDGFWISTQSSDGSFTDAVKLGPPEPFRNATAFDDTRTYGEVGINALTLPWYLSRVHEMDYDLDGRSDLVFWNEDHFDVHRQDARGQFSPLAETFTTEVPFDSDGAYSLIFGFGDKSMFSLLLGFRKSTQQTVLQSLRDMNGDGVGDLVTQSLEGRSIVRQRSLYQVHFGKSTPDGTVFERHVDTTIQPRGRAGGMQASGYSSHWLQDLDGDGRVEVMLGDVRIGLGGMFRALVGNSVPLDLEFYRIEDGGYADKPATRRKIRRFAPFAGVGNVFFPPVLVGDVNGDGRSDLLVGKSPEKLHVFLGVPGPDLLERQPRKLDVALPYDERDTWLVDLNRDGRQDLVMHHGPTDRAPTRPHRLTTLIAQ